jgi:hypothetical protein
MLTPLDIPHVVTPGPTELRLGTHWIQILKELPYYKSLFDTSNEVKQTM